MARPTKLNDDVCEVLCECIELGMAYQHACDCARISYVTFQAWKHKAERIMEAKTPSRYTVDEKNFVTFLNNIKAAESNGIRKNLRNIIKASEGDADNRPQWQAGAWILERRHPEQFARLEKIDQKTEHSGGVSINLTMSDCSKKED